MYCFNTIPSNSDLTHASFEKYFKKAILQNSYTKSRFFYRPQEEATLIPIVPSLNITKKLLPQRHVSKICYEGLLIDLKGLLLRNYKVV